MGSRCLCASVHSSHPPSHQQSNFLPGLVDDLGSKVPVRLAKHHGPRHLLALLEERMLTQL
eukprot:2067523-Pyramimonas_sp.AAC.3